MKYVDSKIFGICNILAKKDINENFCECEDNKNAKYEYYLNTETNEYFALKKDGIKITFDVLVSKFKFTGKILEYKQGIGYYINGEFITTAKEQIEEYYSNLFERDCDI